MLRGIGFIALFVLPLAAGEGKWTPEQVTKLGEAWLKQQGLELPAQRLWDSEKGTGLLAGAIQLGGCSAAFISPTGLIATNHHCVFGILQQHSTAEKDIITGGFLARTRGEELPGSTVRATIPRRFTDVTAEILAAVPPGTTDLRRFRLIEAKKKELVARCEKTPGRRCQVAVFDGGVQYVLVEAFEIADIRLVWAPPRAIGEFGGEEDNWMWPRHTGDVSIVRAYVARDGNSAAYVKANVPYKPAFWFPLSKRGAAPGDFVMVLGYPGRTYRSLIAEEMAERRDLYFARREEVFGEWIHTLEAATKESREGQLAVADTLKSLNNYYKNAQGQLAGFRRGRILEKQQAAEDAVVAWAKAAGKLEEALAGREGLIKLVREQRETWERDFLLRTVPQWPVALAQAATLVRLAAERAKPDMEREPDYMERELAPLKARIERAQKSYFEAADKELFAALLQRFHALPATQRSPAFDRLSRPAIDILYAGTQVMRLEERWKMFEESVAQLQARRDPLLDFAFALDEELRALKDKSDGWEGAVSRLRPAWRAAVMAHAGKPVAPDANGALRVSFARVKGYAPRDGVTYSPQTILAGVVEKHTGKEPFNVPEAILRLASQGEFRSLPVNFLADADTSGGNSGSPVVNGRGELVGLNFDRVWENVANDFGYNPDIARNVSVDVRYALWLLDRVFKADELLKELGVTPSAAR